MTSILKLTLLLFCSFSFAQITTTNNGIRSGNSEDQNSFFGFRTGEFITNGDKNTFIGSKSGANTGNGSNNTFLGFSSGYANTSGYRNVFLGDNSGRFNTSGFSNTFVGTLSGHKNLSGHSNVFLGFSSGYSSKGNRNVFIGRESGIMNINGVKNVFIGDNSGRNELGSNKLYIDNSGTTTPLIYGDFFTNQIGINTKNIPTGYAFAVAGKIITEEVKVKLQSSGWPDFVFNKNYNLPTLKEVETHIKEKGHLKDIPSAKEVSENGILLGDMNAKLLKKLEELTLYTIEQEKKLEEHDKTNQELRERLLKLEQVLVNHKY